MFNLRKKHAFVRPQCGGVGWARVESIQSVVDLSRRFVVALV